MGQFFASATSDSRNGAPAIDLFDVAARIDEHCATEMLMGRGGLEQRENKVNSAVSCYIRKVIRRWPRYRLRPFKVPLIILKREIDGGGQLLKADDMSSLLRSTIDELGNLVIHYGRS